MASAVGDSVIPTGWPGPPTEGFVGRSLEEVRRSSPLGPGGRVSDGGLLRRIFTMLRSVLNLLMGRSRCRAMVL
jgi:hypothetical protein